MSRRTFLVFIDGMGWAAPGCPDNPLDSYGGELFRLPDRQGSGSLPLAKGGWGRPLDAILDVAGVPQSATGQTTLLTGINSQRALGQHLSGFPNPTLRSLLLDHSILKSLAAAGARGAFLNAFRPRFRELSRERQLTLSATTVANLAADLPFFDLADIRAGRSIYQEMTNRELRERGFDLDPLEPAAAGLIAAKATRRYDFLLYEYFQTDKAGHSQDRSRAEAELRLLDSFLGAVLAELSHAADEKTLILVTSDHGNIEDLSTRRHTLNPVPLLAWGDGARQFVAGLTGLDQVAPRILARHTSGR